MNIFTREKLAQLLFIFSMLVAKISLIAVFGFIGFEAYIRWTLNQNFTFLGQGELAALTFSAFGLLLGLNYLHTTRKD